MKLYFQKYSPAVLIVFMLAGLQTTVQAQSWTFRYDRWENRVVRYLALSRGGAGLRLTEMPYTNQDLNLIHDQVKESGIPERGVQFYSHLAQQILDRHKSGEEGQRFYLQWRNRVGYADPALNTEKMRWESDVMGLVRITDNLSLYIDFQADTDGLQDSDYHGYYEWKGEMVGNMRSAWMQYQKKKWSLLIGREFVHWGPGITGSLLTSGLAPALDLIHFRIDLGPFRFQAFNSLLGRSSDEEERHQINRYFSGHRLSYRSGSWELGLHETVMYGGPQETVTAAYLNPLIPYYLTDVMQVQEREDNITIALDASHYFPGGRVYVQYAVDEYYYEGEHYPKRTALLVGGEWINVLGWDKLWLMGEYVRADRWIYNYEALYPWNRLTYYNSHLGHPVGPDADLIHVEAQVFLSSSLLGKVVLQWMRQGETEITTSLYQQEQFEKHHPPFPHGRVERTFTPRMSLIYVPNARWRMNVNWAPVRVENKDHMKGRESTEFRFQVRVEYVFDHVLR
ncbi:MAG: capsule assembly Wzi family protein [bacterium]